MTPQDIEYRITAKGDVYAAEMRFNAPDATLRGQWALPGWHAFKRSKSRSVCKAAIKLDKANRLLSYPASTYRIVTRNGGSLGNIDAWSEQAALKIAREHFGDAVAMVSKLPEPARRS